MKATTIDQEREKILLSLADEAIRSGTLGDCLSLVKYLRERGEKLSVSELIYLWNWGSAYGSELVVFPSVAGFFLHFFEGRPPGRLLESQGLGLLGALLAENLPEQHVDVIAGSDMGELLEPLKLTNLKLHSGTERLADHYDAILSIFSWEVPKAQRSYEVDGIQLDLNDDPGLLVIPELASRLAPNGFFAFVVGSRFFADKSSGSVRQNLSRFGLHLSALLKFRPATFLKTKLGSELAFIDRTPRETLFVAEIPEEIEAQKALIARLRQRKQGPTPSQGRLVPPNQFHGLAALEARERYERLAKGKGLEPVLFSRAVKEIRTPNRGGSDGERYDEHPNAVYLPEMGFTNATIRQDDLPPKLKSYLQLAVDPAVVLPEYLAGVLNTSAGHALREMVMTGAPIRRINRPLLLQTQLYLPSLQEQRGGLLALNEIQRLRSELAELESNYWQQPTNSSDLLDSVRRVNHEERFSDWLETLPFPLASVLRSYHALDRTPKEKYERLLHFFEAFAIFCATIHLSAARTSADWPQQKQQINEVLSQQQLSLKKASFGAWLRIFERMAVVLRAMLREDDGRAKACELYATADPGPLEMLASAELAGLLQRVNSFRNRWTAHGGAVTEAEAIQRRELLENDLAKIREILGTKFRRYQLIEPLDYETLDGPVFRCRIRRVMGSNPQLEHDTVDLITWTYSRRLYLHNPGHGRALELIPLVQVQDTPQPASYFYNRLEKSQPHLVSYQFASNSDMPSSNTALMMLLGEFGVTDAARKPEQ